MENTPNPADEQESKEELTEAIDEGHAFELGAGAGWNHGSNTWEAGNAVENEADDGEGLIERNHRFLAACNAFISGVLGLVSFDHFPFQFIFYL